MTNQAHSRQPSGEAVSLRLPLIIAK